MKFGISVLPAVDSSTALLNLLTIPILIPNGSTKLLSSVDLNFPRRQRIFLADASVRSVNKQTGKRPPKMFSWPKLLNERSVFQDGSS